LSAAKPNKYGVLSTWRKKHLDLRVSKNLLCRALRIMNALLRFFESHGFGLLIGDSEASIETHIIAFGERVPIYIHERSFRRDHQLTEKEQKELKRRPYMYLEKYDYIPSGKLTLQIDSWSASGVRKRWSDGKINRIENLLMNFAISVVRVADVKRTAEIEREERRKRWEEERRRQEELERLRQIEEQRLLDLENQAERWSKSRQLREYIQAVEVSASKRLDSNIPNKQMEKWMSWARKHADQLDPLQGVLPFENDDI
jgi:hypothetical protein